MAKLVEKSTVQLLGALEDHLFLLSTTAIGLSEGDAAYMRQLVAQLRALICKSSGLSGLLWRLCDVLAISDKIVIRSPGSIDPSHPLTSKLSYAGVHVRADGTGPIDIPQYEVSFRKYVEEHEALFIDGESISHEFLINRLANEIGVAHEADGVSRAIAKLSAVRVGEVPSYFPVIEEDARLTLQVGEHVIQSAVSKGYIRRRPPSATPPQKRLTGTPFKFRSDVPATPKELKEGMICLVLRLTKIPPTGKLPEPIYCPPFRQGAICLIARVSRRRRIEVSTSGLPILDFKFDFPLPDPLPDSIAIVVTWKGKSITAWAAGKQVAGPRTDPMSQDQKLHF